MILWRRSQRQRLRLFLTIVAVHELLFADFATGLTLFVDRRKMLVSMLGVGSAAGYAVVNGGAQAACLPGDLSPSCIGVYKVPIDDNIKDMVGSKEALAKFAPDLNYVPPISAPKSAKAAREALEAQRTAVDDIKNVVAAGRLEGAGIKVLNLIPKLTVCGRVLIDDATNRNKNDSLVVAELRQQKLETLFQTAEVAWKNVDITIGQGLRGSLGVSAVAQLTVLSEVREATTALDDFLAAVA